MGCPFRSVPLVRKRTSNESLSWPSVKFRLLVSGESETIRAGPDCLMLSGLIQASIVAAPDRFSAAVILVAGRADAILVDERICRAPFCQAMAAGFSILRLSGWPAPDRSAIVSPPCRHN